MELANSQHERFCQYVSEGKALNQAAINAGYKISCANNIGSRLMRNLTIKHRVEELRHVHGQNGAEEINIRTSGGRISAKEDRWQRLRQITTERAIDPDVQNVPGGKTGFIKKVLKPTGIEWQVDTALLGEMRALEQEVAEESGDKVHRTESRSVSLMLSPLQLNANLKKGLAELPQAMRARALAEHPELSDILDVEPEESSAA